jgi:hypothetical protein
MGLEGLDRGILRLIIDRFGGGPVGIDTISAAIGEERVTIEDVYEPYLMQAGFLHRTQKGRMVTPDAWLHLGLSPPPLASMDKGLQLSFIGEVAETEDGNDLAGIDGRKEEDSDPEY